MKRLRVLVLMHEDLVPPDHLGLLNRQPVATAVSRLSSKVIETGKVLP